MIPQPFSQLEPFPPASDVYDWRGEGKDKAWMPYGQGDIFKEVPLPGVLPDGQSGMAMLFMHPCTMRRGSDMQDRVTVLHVCEKSHKTTMDSPHYWAETYKWLPLPNLLDDQKSAYYGNLMEMATVPIDALERGNRIAQLSAYGRVHMLHRVIFHLTRFAVATGTISQALIRVNKELELQTDWTASVVMGGRNLDAEQVALLEKEFQKVLSEPWHEGMSEGQSIRDWLYAESLEMHTDASLLLAQKIANGDASRCLEPPAS